MHTVSARITLMAVGTYTLPICDGCNLPWLPVGWQQDSDPRNLPEGSKPLRCGKCKSAGWDKLHNAEERKAANETAVNPLDPTKTIELPRNVALNEAMEAVGAVFMPLDPEANADVEAAQEASRLASYVKLVSEAPKPRCRHRMTDCPLCKPEAA
jgi:hypothetical protein